MVDKVTAADIENLVTDGASAARLVNDEKRAINELIDAINNNTQTLNQVLSILQSAPECGPA